MSEGATITVRYHAVCPNCPWRLITPNLSIAEAKVAEHDAEHQARTDAAEALDITGEQVELPPPPAEEKIVDLMQALFDSVEEAKASRKRHVAKRAPVGDHGCG